jgi:hypothetical protein
MTLADDRPTRSADGNQVYCTRCGYAAVNLEPTVLTEYVVVLCLHCGRRTVGTFDAALADKIVREIRQAEERRRKR